MKINLIDRIIFGMGTLCLLSMGAFALTYTKPPTKSGSSSLTAADWNSAWGGIAAWANGRVGGSNMSAADPITRNLLDFDLNNDGSANDAYALTDADIASISVAKFTSLKAQARSSPSLTVDVNKGVYLKTDGSGVFSYPTGGATLTQSPTFTAPGSQARIDVLSVDNDGTLSITQGVVAASPVAPTYPPNKVPIVEVFIRVGSTAIANTDTGQAYIYKDARPIISMPGTLVTTNVIKKTLVLSQLVAEDFNWSDNVGQPVGVPDGWHEFDSDAVTHIGAGNTGAIRVNGASAGDSELLFAKRLVYPAQNDSILEFRAKLTLSNPANVFMGLIKGSPVNAGNADGCFFQHGTGANKVSLTCRNGGASNTQADKQPAAWDWTAYHVFKITYTKTNVEFDIDGTIAGVAETTSANIPQAATDTLHLGMYGTAGTNEGIVLDYSLGYFTVEGGLAP